LFFESKNGKQCRSPIERVGAAGERLSAPPQDGVALSEAFQGRKVDTWALALKRIR
jgi:hypothetical protein